MDEFNEQVMHLARLYASPGWADYVAQRVKEMEPGWPGIAKAVREEVKRLRASKEREVR